MATIRTARTGEHVFTAHNDRGAEVAIGRAGAPGTFSPVELLLAAAAGCVGITAEELILRRVSTPIAVDATDLRPAGAHELDGVRIDLGLDLSTLDDEARAALLAVVDRAVAALCTVTRTLKRSTAVETVAVEISA
ncbi:OsmC family protein [Actinokineospora sp. NBRC 105648]|uniref:OsmC family protein n=1 Tax=Actinokineospora sp. NBRC 105648 TaxID=3032206 RepID=UPI0024A3A169|nr:OsmC family protein [Actinokineospora sp. NBRC 105648]GLZ39569.1 osmotically inducible protein C [Actinokineospora sp. NBRC 105648]